MMMMVMIIVKMVMMVMMVMLMVMIVTMVMMIMMVMMVVMIQTQDEEGGSSTSETWTENSHVTGTKHLQFSLSFLDF